MNKRAIFGIIGWIILFLLISAGVIWYLATDGIDEESNKEGPSNEIEVIRVNDTLEINSSPEVIVVENKS